jgi:hypothetical protein
MQRIREHGAEREAFQRRRHSRAIRVLDRSPVSPLEFNRLRPRWLATHPSAGRPTMVCSRRRPRVRSAGAAETWYVGRAWLEGLLRGSGALSARGARATLAVVASVLPMPPPGLRRAVARGQGSLRRRPLGPDSCGPGAPPGLGSASCTRSRTSGRARGEPGCCPALVGRSPRD